MIIAQSTCEVPTQTATRRTEGDIDEKNDHDGTGRLPLAQVLGPRREAGQCSFGDAPLVRAPSRFGKVCRAPPGQLTGRGRHTPSHAGYLRPILSCPTVLQAIPVHARRRAALPAPSRHATSSRSSVRRLHGQSPPCPDSNSYTVHHRSGAIAFSLPDVPCVRHAPCPPPDRPAHPVCFCSCFPSIPRAPVRLCAS